MITPALSFSESALVENMRKLNCISADSNHRWAARLTSSVPANLLRDVILPVMQLAACSTVADAEYLADAGFHRIILTGRVVDTESLRRLRLVAERTQIVAVIDHFCHAELLSQCVSPSASEIQILIEADVGRQSTGVQPGSDAALLAAATSTFPGLKVIGVFASAVDFRLGLESGGSARDPAAVVRIADHARRSIQNVAADCREIVVAVSSASESMFEDSPISCLVVSPFSSLDDPSDQVVPQSCICIVATVISRPSLEWCVIDAGTLAFFDTRELRVEAPSGASVLHVMHETCTLQLTGESNDLRIGDTVRLTVRNPEYLLQRNGFSEYSTTTS